ncbi:MAG: hypothetical protein HC934_05535 [Acaryochloridaceae cyanobacterium SU_2_1]|nr:hypothetical protein [Acaryochloridaceae cyanobacterium SU_2_1]
MADACRITKRLLDLLPFLQNIKLNIDEVELINRGIIDLIAGLVVCQDFSPQGQELEQVTLRTHDQENVILTTNPDVSLNSQRLSFLSSPEASSNGDLINRSKIIQINNLSQFQAQFQNAAQFGQLVTCIYNDDKHEITLLNIRSLGATAHHQRKNGPKYPTPLRCDLSVPFRQANALCLRRQLAAGEALFITIYPPSGLMMKKFQG